MPRGKPHDPELRAQVVAALVTGAALHEVVERFGVPKQTALEWKQAAMSDLVRTTGARERAHEDLVDLVTTLVHESIRTLVAQSRVAGRDSWIERQGAADLAAYRGIEFDRLIRLLPAFQRVAEPPAIEGAVVDAPAGAADTGV